MTTLIAERNGLGLHYDRIKTLFAQANYKIAIASPYVTESALILSSKGKEIRLLTTLNAEDIACGATSPRCLLKLLKAGVECRSVENSPKLHAKVYIFDRVIGVVTSANLTMKGLSSNIEVGVELEGEPVKQLKSWFDDVWFAAQPIDQVQLLHLEKAAKNLRRFHRQFQEKTRRELPRRRAGTINKEIEALFEHPSTRFFICNTDRRQGERTAAAGYIVEKSMRDEGYAAAWESFKYPSHMTDVKSGDAILMYAKGVGVIAIGRAMGRVEILDPGNPNRLYHEQSREWRIPTKWLAWQKDGHALRWRSPNMTFWNIDSDSYSDLREAARIHFSGS